MPVFIHFSSQDDKWTTGGSICMLFSAKSERLKDEQYEMSQQQSPCYQMYDKVQVKIHKL